MRATPEVGEFEIMTFFLFDRISIFLLHGNSACCVQHRAGIHIQSRIFDIPYIYITKYHKYPHFQNIGPQPVIGLQCTQLVFLSPVLEVPKAGIRLYFLILFFFEIRSFYQSSQLRGCDLTKAPCHGMKLFRNSKNLIGFERKSVSMVSGRFDISKTSLRIPVVYDDCIFLSMPSLLFNFLQDCASTPALRFE